MADITYTVDQESPEGIPGFEQYQQEDKYLINEFQINNLFDPTKHTVELHILDFDDQLIESEYQYISYKQLGNAQSAGKAGASILTIDPIDDSKAYGYPNGGIKLLYHFLSNLYSTDKAAPEFYIDSISPDRTELKLSSLALTKEEIVLYTEQIKTNLKSQSYFNDFRLNFGVNDLFIGINIDTLDLNSTKAVVIRLYEPLPETYTTKDVLTIVEVVADSIAYTVDSIIEIPAQELPTLRPANFNIEIADESVVPTGYLSYDELFSYPANNTNSQVYSLFNEKGIEVSVDYTDYADFVHFSSAQERLINFKYKLDLINSYSASIAAVSTPGISGSQGLVGSLKYYEELTAGIYNNFDSYERFLYYESGSSSWPKSNTTKPYINKPSSAAESITWYANQNSEALYYDQTNNNSLVNSIPTYLRDDESNANYLMFIHMVGQHFDNLWLYSKAVTDKYDTDNRANRGISKDLVGEALKNFGVKLYTSNNSIQDLFSSIVGQTYQSGSEVINNYITGSLAGTSIQIQPIGYEDYQKEVYKRIYHNLPLLLKSKGTERGLRALINCFGIPSDVLDIKLYGGRNTNENSFYGDYRYATSSLDKIRLDNTGSIIAGDTLTQTTSIQKRDNKYTDDLHQIEVGFSPTDNVDNYIISQSSATFNIDQYLGDPGSLYEDNYQGLGDYAQTILGNLDQYNLQDYVRLIKFFDNVIFKMVKDFIPARSVADTGVIIKPNLLNRSKAKSVQVSTILIDYTGSIETANISGSHGEAYLDRDASYTTNYARNVQTSEGLVSNRETFERPKYNGELSNSGIVISNGELNAQNTFKIATYQPFNFATYIVNSSEAVCILFSTPGIEYVTTLGSTYQTSQLFTGTNPGTTYTTASGADTPVVTLPPFTFNDKTKINQTVFVSASHTGLEGTCQASKELFLAFCDLDIATSPITTVDTSTTYYLSDFINVGPSQFQADPSGNGSLRIAVTLSNGAIVTQVNTVQGNDPVISFNLYEIGDVITITVTDKYVGVTPVFNEELFCFKTVTVTVSECKLSAVLGSDIAQLRYKISVPGSKQYLALRNTQIINTPIENTYVRAGESLYSNNGTGVDSFFNGVVNNRIGNNSGNTRYSVYEHQSNGIVIPKFENRTIQEGPNGELGLRLEMLVPVADYGLTKSFYRITATNYTGVLAIGSPTCTDTVYVYQEAEPNVACSITYTQDPNTGQSIPVYNCISS